MAMKAQSGSPPSEEGDADSEEPAAPGPAAPGFAEEEPAPWEAPAAGTPEPEPEPEPEFVPTPADKAFAKISSVMKNLKRQMKQVGLESANND